MEEQEGSGSRGANESREVIRGYFDKIQAVWSLCGHVNLNHLRLRNASVSEQPITTLYGLMTTNNMNAGVSSSALRFRWPGCPGQNLPFAKTSKDLLD